MKDHELWEELNNTTFSRRWKYPSRTFQDWLCIFGIHKYRNRKFGKGTQQICKNCGKVKKGVPFIIPSRDTFICTPSGKMRIHSKTRKRR